MSSVDISQVSSIAADRGYPVMFQTYEAVPQVAPLICEMVDTDGSKFGDKGTVITGFGTPKVHRGGEIEASSFQDAYTWRCHIDRIADRMVLDKRLLMAADANVQIGNMISRMAAEWGRSFALQKEQRVANFFQKGTIAAGNVEVFDGSFPGEPDTYPGFIYDGKPLFAASGNGHVLAKATATPYNLTAALDLTSTNLQTVLTTMRSTNAVDDRGQKIMVMPRDLIVPPGLEYTAKALVNSTLVPGSANNDINVLQGLLRPVVWPMLTDDADAWFVGAGRGIRVYDSGVPQIEVQFDTSAQEVHVVAYSYHGIVCTDWRGYYAANKATS